MNQTNKKAALEYLKRGFRPIPVHYITKTGGCSCRKGLKCPTPGKHPVPDGWNKPEKCKIDAAVIENFWKYKDYNVGICTGTVSRDILYLDIDTHDPAKNGFETLARLEETNGKLPATLSQRTGGGGEGRLFYVNADVLTKIKNEAGIAPGLDIRTTGGQFVAPPSVHKSGKKYEWIDPYAKIVDAPEWLIQLCLKASKKEPAQKTSTEAQARPTAKAHIELGGSMIARYVEKALARACEAISTAPKGEKNGTFNKEAFSMGTLIGAGVLDRGTAETALTQAAKDTGYTDERDIAGILKSSLDAGIAKPRDMTKIIESAKEYAEKATNSLLPVDTGEELPRSMEEMRKVFNPARDTDQGNAERLLSKVREKIRFTREAGWMLWNGKKWIADDTAVKNLARETILETIMEQVEEATQARNTNLTRELAYWWKRSENETKISGALAMTEGVKGVYVKKADFDKDQMLFNAQNGIIDLKTGELRPHDPAALMTRASTVAYDQNADCPLFKKFLSRIMGDSQGLIDFIQKAIGYTLTGAVKEQCWFFLYGRGQNGKSTLIDVICKLMGEYTGKTGIETFMPKANQQTGNTPEIAALDGARFVYASETEEGKALAAGRMKDMTGGEQIPATPKYRDPYNFYPVWKIWVSGNHKPTIKDTTISTWRRIRMIPFSIQIPESERDPDLPAKLETELPGILKWAVDGCLAWQRAGLKPSKEVTDATKAYQDSQDILGKFIEECCVVSPRMLATAKNLYESYCKWSEENGERFPKTQRVFGEALTERGFDRRRGAQGVGIWAGIALLHWDNEGDESDPCDPKLAKTPIDNSKNTSQEKGSQGSLMSPDDEEEEIQ